MLLPNPFDTHGRAAKYVINEIEDFFVLSLRVQASQDSDPEMELLSQTLSSLGSQPKNEHLCDEEHVGVKGAVDKGGVMGDQGIREEAIGESGDETLCFGLHPAGRRPRRLVPLGPAPDNLNRHSDLHSA